MDYYINPQNLCSAFTLPTKIADNHLRFASFEHLKVILYMFRHISEEISLSDITDALGIDEYTVTEALMYWEQAGILLKKNSVQSQEKSEPSVITQNKKPTRSDVAKRGLDDPKIRHLLSEAQFKFGRGLKSNEASTLVWLCDDLGLDISIILIILQLAVERDKCNIRFIESTAVDWVNRGITTLALADEEIRRSAIADKAWLTVCSAFGLEKRKPSKKEESLSLLWINDWEISKEMLKCAYDACVDAKSKFSFAYTAKIIEAWHEKGFKAPEDIESDKPAKQDDSFAAYDIDLFEKMINSKD